ERFHVHGYCPKEYFDDLLAAIRRGHVDHFRVAMETTMWRDQIFGPLYLAPSIHRESSDPDFETGTISMLPWNEKCSFRPPEQTKPQVAELPKPQAVELPARLYSMLNVLIVIGALVLLLLLLSPRH